jgi:hypothetical protein
MRRPSVAVARAFAQNPRCRERSGAQLHDSANETLDSRAAFHKKQKNDRIEYDYTFGVMFATDSWVIL